MVLALKTDHDPTNRTQLPTQFVFQFLPINSSAVYETLHNRCQCSSGTALMITSILNSRDRKCAVSREAKTPK